ncbi:hypothetical protein QQ045_029459 [Rhodiola kirilowii]
MNEDPCTSVRPDCVQMDEYIDAEEIRSRNCRTDGNLYVIYTKSRRVWYGWTQQQMADEFIQ